MYEEKRGDEIITSLPNCRQILQLC